MLGSTFVSIEKFAELEGLTPDTVRGMREKGYLPVGKVGKRAQIDKELFDLRRRMDNGTLAEYNQLKNYGLEG